MGVPVAGERTMPRESPVRIRKKIKKIPDIEKQRQRLVCFPIKLQGNLFVILMSNYLFYGRKFWL